MSELQGIARFKSHPTRLRSSSALSDQCIEIVRTKDTGTLQYDIYLNDDRSRSGQQEDFIRQAPRRGAPPAGGRPACG